MYCLVEVIASNGPLLDSRDSVLLAPATHISHRPLLHLQHTLWGKYCSICQAYTHVGQHRYDRTALWSGCRRDLSLLCKRADNWLGQARSHIEYNGQLTLNCTNAGVQARC